MKWAFGILLIFLIIFFGRIFYVGVEHKSYSTEFKKECTAKGGVVVKDTGKGWTRYYCIDKDVVIQIDTGK